MLRTASIAISVTISGTLQLALAQGPITGQWSVGGPIVQNKINLSLGRTAPGFNMSNSGMVELSQFRGLTQAQLNSTAAGAIANFDLVRDAGTFHFEGYIKGGSGGGTFTFAQNANYAAEMRGLGYTGLDDEKVFAMAVHDVSAAYVRALNAQGLRPDSTDQLVTMRIHNVTPEFVADFRSLGYTNLSADKLVTMRIHNVTTAFARDLKAMGYNSVTEDQLVTMRIHGVSTDLIREVEAQGFGHPSIDQVVTMRIHGITPDYIQRARAAFKGNLTIDQLVSMKIHGVLD
jgi:hypothetical protein